MIAQASDTRDTLGAFASKVTNRSLLFEKMVLVKSWGHETHDTKFHDANRFNVIRAATGGQELLRQAVDESEARIRGRNTQDHVREEHRYRKKVASELAQIQVDNAQLIELRVKSSLTFLQLLEKSYRDRHRSFIGELGGRLLINMAGGVQENAGISLDRCFGLPLIPGSAAKGVSRHHALWEIKSCENSEQRRQILRAALLIFGFIKQDLELRKTKKGQIVTNWAWATEDSPELLETIREDLKALDIEDDCKGLISFLPASPASERHLRIVAEGITPHTDQRTGGEATRLVPLAFPAVERGSQFAFSLILNRAIAGIATGEQEQLLDQASAWLQAAVTGTGIGAKTAAGYGWFVIDEEAAEKRRQAAEALAREEAEKAEAMRRKREAAEAEAERMAALSPIDRHAEEIEALDDNGFAAKAKDLISGDLADDELRAFFRVLQSSAKKDRRKQWKKKKADELWKPLVEAAAKFDIELN